MLKNIKSNINGFGFTYPELLLVVLIILTVFFFTFPLYKRFNAEAELKNTAQVIRDQLRIAHNKAINGVQSENSLITHWVFHVHRSANEYEYESAACPVIEDPSATGYLQRYNFNSCPNRSDYILFDFPKRLAISHQYDLQPEVDLFFESISGYMKVYDQSGNYLGDTIDINISSDEYPDISVLFHVNGKGNISEEKI